ncbi:MAG: glycosyltransferase [Chloroflexi bacterium]|jgi:glycosyltransferase involved in cell wall biosynthesis|nr:glycosyltransferase [Chloroflexota bacterium]
MYIAHMIDSLTVGGAQTLILTFAKALREINTESSIQHKFAVINLGYSTIQKSLEDQGAVVFTLESDRLISPKENLALLGILRREKFDAVHSHLTRSNILGAVLGSLMGIPSVCTLHSTSEDPRHHNPKRYQLETWALQNFAHKVFAVGHSVAQVHQARFQSKTIEILLNPVDEIPEIAPKARLRLRAALSGDARRPLIIAVGRLLPPKGYQDLISAFAILRKTHPEAFLAIAGKGFLQDDLAQQIERSGLHGHARLLGNREDVPALLKAADIFASSSHWEGLPLAILEAMSAGLPIVATDVGDIAHIVNAQRGLVVPPHKPKAIADALAQLLSDPDQRRAFGKAGMVYVAREHNALAWTQYLLDTYEAIQYDRSVRNLLR